MVNMTQRSMTGAMGDLGLTRIGSTQFGEPPRSAPQRDHLRRPGNLDNDQWRRRKRRLSSLRRDLNTLGFDTETMGSAVDDLLSGGAI
jgi:hypothetical protein